jgi:hypothetical protein
MFTDYSFVQEREIAFARKLDSYGLQKSLDMSYFVCLVCSENKQIGRELI